MYKKKKTEKELRICTLFLCSISKPSKVQCDNFKYIHAVHAFITPLLRSVADVWSLICAYGMTISSNRPWNLRIMTMLMPSTEII